MFENFICEKSLKKPLELNVQIYILTGYVILLRLQGCGFNLLKFLLEKFSSLKNGWIFVLLEIKAA